MYCMVVREARFCMAEVCFCMVEAHGGREFPSSSDSSARPPKVVVRHGEGSIPDVVIKKVLSPKMIIFGIVSPRTPPTMRNLNLKPLLNC